MTHHLTLIGTFLATLLAKTPDGTLSAGYGPVRPGWTAAVVSPPPTKVCTTDPPFPLAFLACPPVAVTIAITRQAMRCRPTECTGAVLTIAPREVFLDGSPQSGTGMLLGRKTSCAFSLLVTTADLRERCVTITGCGLDAQHCESGS